MIQRFIEKWDNGLKAALTEKWSSEYPSSYDAIFKALCEGLAEGAYTKTPDPERIHVIDDGHYQGTRVFLVAESGYQPFVYWMCKMYYGSCSGCDTFQRIYDSGPWGGPITEQQTADFVQLALHMLQAMKEV